MKYFWLVGIILALSACKKEAAVENAPVGEVISTEGEALITRGANTLPAALNAPLFLNDVIETKTGKIKIKFKDDSTFALSDNSKIIITQFLMDSATNTRTSKIDMAKGQLRSVVSKHFTGAGSEVNIATPTAVAGIRGTELAVAAEPDKSSVYVLDGTVEVYKPQEPEKRVNVTKDNFAEVEKERPIAAPKPIPAELRQKLFEGTDYMPSDFREKAKIFEAEFEAKKAEMKAKAEEVKKKMEEKKKEIEEKMQKQKEEFEQKAKEKLEGLEQKSEGVKSDMDKKKEELLDKMKSKWKLP